MGNQDDYAFHWRAKFTDGTILKQFDEDGTAHSFVEVQAKEDALVFFWLEAVDSPDPFSIGVSLTDGAFNINEFVINALREDKPWSIYNPEFRIINFRRVREHFTLDEPRGHDVDYFIGWQVTHDGKNYKKLLCFNSNGEWWMS